MRTYWSPSSPSSDPCAESSRPLRLERLGVLHLGLPVRRHRLRTGRRVEVRVRIRGDPLVERGPQVRPEPAQRNLLGVRVLQRVRTEPRVEDERVADAELKTLDLRGVRRHSSPVGRMRDASACDSVDHFADA